MESALKPTARSIAWGRGLYISRKELHKNKSPSSTHTTPTSATSVFLFSHDDELSKKGVDCGGGVSNCPHWRENHQGSSPRGAGA